MYVSSDDDDDYAADDDALRGCALRNIVSSSSLCHSEHRESTLRGLALRNQLILSLSAIECTEHNTDQSTYHSTRLSSEHTEHRAEIFCMNFSDR